MIRKIGIITAVVALASTIGASATADPESCRDALDQLRSAKSEVIDGIRAFASCVSSSDGHDDCSTEFSTLHSAEDDFESAVSEYESECS
jgi:hypothetical protein